MSSSTSLIGAAASLFKSNKTKTPVVETPAPEVESDEALASDLTDSDASKRKGYSSSMLASAKSAKTRQSVFGTSSSKLG